MCVCACAVCFRCSFLANVFELHLGRKLIMENWQLDRAGSVCAHVNSFNDSKNHKIHRQCYAWPILRLMKIVIKFSAKMIEVLYRCDAVRIQSTDCNALIL